MLFLATRFVLKLGHTLAARKEQHQRSGGRGDADERGHLDGHAEPDLRVAEIGDAHHGHEGRRKGRYPVEALAAGKVDGDGPQGHAGHGLVGPAEVAPDDREVH